MQVADNKNQVPASHLHQGKNMTQDGKIKQEPSKLAAELDSVTISDKAKAKLAADTGDGQEPPRVKVQTGDGQEPPRVKVQTGDGQEPPKSK